MSKGLPSARARVLCQTAGGCWGGRGDEGSWSGWGDRGLGLAVRTERRGREGPGPGFLQRLPTTQTWGSEKLNPCVVN